MLLSVIRVLTASLLGFGSGYLTKKFTDKKDPTGKYTKEAGMKIVYGKIASGLALGIYSGFPSFSVLKGLILAIIIGIISIASVYKRLDKKISVIMLTAEFVIIGLVISIIVQYIR